MEDMSSKKETNDLAREIAQYLQECKGEDVTALDVSANCSWADVFIVATANSQGQLRGLVDLLDTFFKEKGIILKNSIRKMELNQWVLLDCDPIIIHLMDKKTREFYDLENLWFEAERLV